MKQILKCIGWVSLNFALQIVVQIAYCISVAAELSAAELTGYIMDNILVITLISNEIFIALMLLTGKIKRHRLKERWGVFRPELKAALLPCVCAFLFSLGFAFLTFDTEAGNSLAIQNSVSYFSEKMPFAGIMLMIINLLVLAPVAEEMLCRGIMINGLKEKFSENTALVISSVIFGAMHLMAGGPVLSVGCVIMGLLLGLTYKKTGSLVSAIIVHSAANLPDFILMALPPLSDPLRLGLTIGCIIASAVVLEFWYGFKKEKTK